MQFLAYLTPFILGFAALGLVLATIATFRSGWSAKKKGIALFLVGLIGVGVAKTPWLGPYTVFEAAFAFAAIVLAVIWIFRHTRTQWLHVTTAIIALLLVISMIASVTTGRVATVPAVLTAFIGSVTAPTATAAPAPSPGSMPAPRSTTRRSNRPGRISCSDPGLTPDMRRDIECPP